MKEEFITFLNKGERIVGTIHIPEEIPAPGIILCHGLTGNRIESHRLFVHTARELCRRGFTVLRFDFRGCGESEGLFESITISEEVNDLKAAIDWLHSRGEILSSKIGTIGLSLGGVVSLIAAAEDERIKAVCTWSTPAEFKDLEDTAKSILGGGKIEEWIMRGYLDLPSGDRIGRDFLEDALRHNILESAAKISPRPLLIIHASNDVLVPVSHAEKLFKNAGEPKEKFIVEGADHTFNRWDWQWLVINYTVDWFKKNLKSG
jgi:pimeloyl-ACP methyl ester carboxylesterase